MAKRTVKKASADKSKPAAKKQTAKTKKTTSAKKVGTSKAKTTATKKSPAKKATIKKSPAKKATIKKSPAKKATTKKSTVKKPVVKVEASKSKSKKKAKGYNKSELKVFKSVILEKRSEIIEQLENLKDQMMDSSTGQYVNENSPYSLHMAEQGTDAQEREKLYLWAQRESKFLAYLEDALQRIELGTYGICIECMDEPKNLCPTCPLIPKKRLMAVPHTQHCVEVKNTQYKK